MIARRKMSQIERKAIEIGGFTKLDMSRPCPAQVEIVASGREAVVFLNALVNQRHAYPTRQGGEALHVLAHPDVVVLARLAEAARRAGKG